MRKEIKVWLQYPWKVADSSYYKYLIDFLPEDIVFLNTQKQKGVITSPIKFKLMNKLKNVVRFFLKVVKVPNITRPKEGNYDLVHCAHCLSMGNKPWVVDVEHYWNFASSGDLAYSKTGRIKIEKMLKRSSCKKILPWSEAAKKTIIDNLESEEIKRKIEVLYPSVPFLKYNKIIKKNIVFIFIGRYFYFKGGLHALEAIDQLTKKYNNVNGIFVSITPKEIFDKYSKNKRIKFYDLMPQNKLFDLYKESDIFLYPGYSDTFTTAIPEAMMFGLPTITVDGFAKDEMVDDKKTGFLVKGHKEIDPKIIGITELKVIEDIVKMASQLIENKTLLKKMSKNCIEEVKNGKFSIKERNRKLRKIYEEALK